MPASPIFLSGITVQEHFGCEQEPLLADALPSTPLGFPPTLPRLVKPATSQQWRAFFVWAGNLDSNGGSIAHLAELARAISPEFGHA
ncbi:hypothetical protein, partial [Mesorhizobium sp. STM 4661]|uniref:hypothetical protein n=1 Tax=Mesorhizobium sp. STM 4661 TaxID=1297570 RepID=UPI001AEC16B8